LVVADLFVALNGLALNEADVECVTVWQKRAAGEMDEWGLSQWFEKQSAHYRKICRRAHWVD
jgi:prophage maintenance system killer protein